MLTWPMVGRLAKPRQQSALVAVLLLLALVETVFVFPAINAAVIGPFWFLLKAACLLYVMIWFRGTFPATAMTSS